MKKQKIINLFWILSILSCNMPSISNREYQETNFPLKQYKVFEVRSSIQNVAAADTWFVIQSPSTLMAVDINTGKSIWTKYNFLSDIESEFLILNDTLYVSSYDKMLTVDKFGNEESINLNSNTGDVIRFIAKYDNYVYLIRGPLWILEAYDISQNNFLWKLSVGKGQTSVFYDKDSGTVYIVTVDSVIALNNKTGIELWQRRRKTTYSTFDMGIIYLCSQFYDSSIYKLDTLDTETQNRTWENEIKLQDSVEVHDISVIKNLLLISARNSILALDKTSGEFFWRSSFDDIFYTKPIEFNDILYTKGSSGVIYAISLANGSVLGYKETIKNEFVTGIYRLSDGILFNSDTTVYIYK